MSVREEPEGKRLQPKYLNEAGVFNLCRSVCEHEPSDVSSLDYFNRAAAVLVPPAQNNQDDYFTPIQQYRIPAISYVRECVKINKQVTFYS